MVNVAHGSDSYDSLLRECKIIGFGLGGESKIKKIIDLWYLDDDDNNK